jgi:hypothetical protein
MEGLQSKEQLSLTISSMASKQELEKVESKDAKLAHAKQELATAKQELATANKN